MNQNPTTNDLLPLPEIVRQHDDGSLPVKRTELPKKKRPGYQPTPYMVRDNGRWHRVYRGENGVHQANFDGTPAAVDVKEPA
jgi:hypothetical protein